MEREIYIDRDKLDPDRVESIRPRIFKNFLIDNIEHINTYRNQHTEDWYLSRKLKYVLQNIVLKLNITNIILKESYGLKLLEIYGNKYLFIYVGNG